MDIGTAVQVIVEVCQEHAHMVKWNVSISSARIDILSIEIKGKVITYIYDCPITSLKYGVDLSHELTMAVCRGVKEVQNE